MTTLATMKARIASELRRSNISAQIASAIETAIEAYQHERFFFNETREIEFNTVAGQDRYDGDDNAFIPRIVRFDYVKTEISDTYHDLEYKTPERVEALNGTGDFTGQPLSYSYYNQQFLIYPMPADAYPIRIGAQVTIAAPASDVEANNPWMTRAEKLIRCRAKYELYQHVMMDAVQAAMFNPDNDTGPTAKALEELRIRTNAVTNQGGYVVTPTCF